MTEEQNKLAELVVLSEKATQGKWILHQQPNYCAINAEKQGSLGGDLGVARSNGAKRNIADLNFIISLVNWFRANQASLREPATEAVLEALKAARSWLESDEGEGRTFAEMIEIEDRSLASSGKHAWNRDFISMVRKVEAALKGKGASQGASNAAPQVPSVSEANALEKQPAVLARWIPLSESLPNPKGPYVVLYGDNDHTTGGGVGIPFCASNPEYAALHAVGRHYTHWMPLPAAPDEQKG